MMLSVAASALLAFVLVGIPTSLQAATSTPARPRATAASPRMELQPTPSCPQNAVGDLNKAINFVQGQTWAERPGDNPLLLSPDLNACKVVLSVGHLSKTEEAALYAGAGSRLAITYRRDWARPSRSLLILWIVFGGAGVVWVFRRYARR